MPNSSRTWMLIAMLFAACGTEPSPPAGAPEESPHGRSEAGLEITIHFPRTTFGPEEKITAEVLARNTGEAPLRLFNFDLDWWHQLTLTNIEDGSRWLGGAGLFIDVEAPLDLTLPAGGTWKRTAKLNDGRRRFLRIMENRQPGDDWDYRESLPAGRYRVSIRYEPGISDESYYLGTPTSNEVEISIEN
jgi:hypothetical protein